MTPQVERSKKRIVWFAVITLVFVVTTAYLLRDALLTSSLGNRLLDGFLAVLVISGVPTTVRKLRAEVAAFRTANH
ncbi:MAG: hypothetical protein H0X37_01820 [Herpetosiphonaceae bacterium]|nr:hypothetical protein [Herpetosiphonaceae bacterium]